MTYTRAQLDVLETEVKRAVTRSAWNINAENCTTIFDYKYTGRDYLWTVSVCNECAKPNLLHTDPWTGCDITGEPVDPDLTAEYVDIIARIKRIKQLAGWYTPAFPESTPTTSAERPRDDYSYDKHVIFPLWGEKMTWEEYKTQIYIYKDASSKKPVSMFLDMIKALKASKKDTMSTRLSQALGEERKSDNINEKSITWIETHFGQTPIEQTDKAMEALQTIRRETGEDITEFIQRFEGVMEQLRLIRF